MTISQIYCSSYHFSDFFPMLYSMDRCVDLISALVVNKFSYKSGLMAT